MDQETPSVVDYEHPLEVGDDLCCPACGHDMSKYFVAIGCPNCKVVLHGLTNTIVRTRGRKL